MNDIVCDLDSLETLFTLGATVTTGFEWLAKEEIEEKLHAKCATGHGKVYFQISFDSIGKVHQLRSVDRLFLVIKTFSNYEYSEQRQTAIKDLKALVSSIAWNKVLLVWSENCKHQKVVHKQRIKKTENSEDLEPILNGLEIDNEKDLGDLVRFRASANRIGKKQSITSPDAEQHFGGALQDLTNWKVDLTTYNLEVLITLGTDFVMVCLSLTHESLHRRNIIDFGYTTLRASIAYNMLRMCTVKSGEVVIDPMCGSGAIPIEGALEWPNSFHIGGDHNSIAIKKSLSNITSVNQSDNTKPIKAPVDIFRWDVRKLPFATGTIDVIVTDLPFGKRLGSKANNHKLYPSLLVELARVCKKDTGRACFLTNDKRSIVNAISYASKLWLLKRTVFINMGGLRAAVYYLKRTNN